MNDFLQTFFFQVRLKGFKHASLKQTTVNRKELPALSGNYDRQTDQTDRPINKPTDKQTEVGIYKRKKKKVKK